MPSMLRPNKAPSRGPFTSSSKIRPRNLVLLLSALSFAYYLFILRPNRRLSIEEEEPPNYDALREWERNLPQHNTALPAPEGKNGRYVKFSNQVVYLGWNNVFNELLMNTHLAYESKRAFVWIDYHWKNEYYHWQKSLEHKKPLTPLNAIIAGPSAGGAWEPDDPAPRSVHDSYWEKVCPENERRRIYTQDVKPAVADGTGVTGQQVFDHWKNILLYAPENCIEVMPAPSEVDGYPQTFDLWFWGHGTVLDMWERFIKSPTSRLLKPSPIVRAAVERNEYLFMPTGSRPPTSARTLDPYEHLLAVHVRRGDFKDACISLSTWKSSYYSWNLLPQLPDKFSVPADGQEGVNTPEREAYYLKHCLPTSAEIIQKIHDSRAEYVSRAYETSGVLPRLDVVYLLTNEQGEWLDDLKVKLRKDGWHTIATSRDLVLDKQQRDVDMAVDMEIARRAAVFIGNGWSSFTSNIVHQRLANDKDPISCRFY